MRSVGAAAVALAMLGGLEVQPGVAQEYASPLVPPRPSAPVPDDVRTAWGCVTGGTIGTVTALMVSPVNLLNVVAGGVVSPANTGVLAVGLAGVVFATFCALGESLTPLYIHYIGDAPLTALSSGVGIVGWMGGEPPLLPQPHYMVAEPAYEVIGVP